jgi:hypothetical protein
MKDSISCGDAIKLKEEFFDQKLGYDQMAEIDKHLEDCENCRSEYSEYEKKLLTRNSDSANYDFSKFEYALTLKIIGKTLKYGAITLCIWYLLTSFIFPLLLSNQIRIKAEKAQIALTDLVAFTMPEYIASNSNSNSGPWNQKIKIDLKNTLIHGSDYAGYIDAAVPLYVGEADIKLVDVHRSGNRYLLPSQWYYSKGKSIRKGGINDQIKEKLSSFADGTITKFSLSFNRPISALEMDTLVKTLGLSSTSSNICWVAVDTGIDMTKGENMFKSYRNPISSDLWGFPLTFFNSNPVSEKMQTGASSWTSEGIADDKRCRQSSENFKKEMKLFEEYSVYLDDITLTKEIKRINEYLAKNEITFYGAVLVAPTKNIFNIKDVDFIGDMQIINVDFDY